MSRKRKRPRRLFALEVIWFKLNISGCKESVALKKPVQTGNFG